MRLIKPSGRDQPEPEPAPPVPDEAILALGRKSLAKWKDTRDDHRFLREN